MKNLIEEKPNTRLTGRLKRTFKFVDSKDIANKLILDIGCGYGWFEWNAFQKNAKSIVGVEVSEEDLSTVKKYIKNPNFTPVVGSASKMPLKDSSFDTVVAWEVIEHIPKNTEQGFFKEVYRLLKKNGTFYISTPHQATFSTYLDPAFWLIGHRHYSYRKLVQYGLENNFVVEKVTVTGGIWTAISLINMYVSKWIFRRERFFKNFFLAKEDEEYRRHGFYNIFIKYRKN